MASAGCQKLYFLKLFILVKKHSTHLPPARMGLRQNPSHASEHKFACAALEVMRKGRNPGSVSAAKSSLSVAQVSYVLAETYAPYCATPHPCKGL